MIEIDQRINGIAAAMSVIIMIKLYIFSPTSFHDGEKFLQESDIRYKEYTHIEKNRKDNFVEHTEIYTLYKEIREEYTQSDGENIIRESSNILDDKGNFRSSYREYKE